MSENPFKYINAINEGKWLKVDNGYEPFLITRFFSYFIDTVLIANEANQFNSFNVNKQQHFDYFFGLVSRKKRFTKWYKSDKIENLDIIMEYFSLSKDKALEILEMMTKEEVEELKRSYEELL